MRCACWGALGSGWGAAGLQLAYNLLQQVPLQSPSAAEDDSLLVTYAFGSHMRLVHICSCPSLFSAAGDTDGLRDSEYANYTAKVGLGS